MKIFKIILFHCLLVHCYFPVFSQPEKRLPLNEPDYHKSRMFNDLPEKMLVPVEGMDSLLFLKKGSVIDAKISDQFRYTGIVISTSSSVNHNYKSVVIKSINRPGAIFTFTKTINAKGSFSYSGRIISRDHGDVFEMINENGQYYFQKKNIYDVINE